MAYELRVHGLAPAEIPATEPSPACAHSTHYLLAVAYDAPYEVAVAALLPCSRIYRDVGEHLLGTARPDNPYQTWIDTYADEAFAAGVRKVIAISDQVAETASARSGPDVRRLRARHPLADLIEGLRRVSDGALWTPLLNCE